METYETIKIDHLVFYKKPNNVNYLIQLFFPVFELFTEYLKLISFLGRFWGASANGEIEVTLSNCAN